MREAEAMKKYENLIFYKQPEHVTALVDGTPLEVTDDVEGVGMRGACQIPGAHAFINGGLVTEPVFMDPYPHKHDADEYLVFLGPPNDRYHFNAHVELTMGIDEDAEVYNIDEPTMVRIPAGVWHCPLNFIRVDEPIFFQVVLQQGAFGGLYRLPDGEKEMFYNGPIQCILNPKKTCDTCKKCLSLSWDAVLPGKE